MAPPFGRANGRCIAAASPLGGYRLRGGFSSACPLPALVEPGYPGRRTLPSDARSNQSSGASPSMGEAGDVEPSMTAARGRVGFERVASLQEDREAGSLPNRRRGASHCAASTTPDAQARPDADRHGPWRLGERRSSGALHRSPHRTVGVRLAAPARPRFPSWFRCAETDSPRGCRQRFQHTSSTRPPANLWTK
jgi:hypothetical protein